MSTAPSEINPILLEVIKNAFDTIADEMALIIMRTGYSEIVRDAMDYSTALCDAKGQTLAQGLTTPLHLGSFYDAMRALIEQYEGRIHPDDIYIFNDPYSASGQHLPDIYIIKPIFIEGELWSWATTIAHHVDVGGIVPGSNSIGATEIYQEGLRIPILKLYDRGKANQSIWDIIRQNVRLPEKVLGDLGAQISACHGAERKFTDLFNRYGPETMALYIEEIHNYAERIARAEIAGIPDGTYEFTDHLDGLGSDTEPIIFKLKLTVEGEEIIVDWTGTSPAVKGGINSPVPFTKAAAYTAIKCVMASDIPNSHGFNRPITVIAPEGTVVNPQHPFPCGARGISGFRMIDCIFGALAQAVPDRVTADGNGGSTLVGYGGYQDGKPFVYVETIWGTWGGATTHDGQEGVPHMGANQSNVPIEMIEAEQPLRVERYSYLPDTGGPGKFRGGLSTVRDVRVLADEAVLTVRTDKRRYPPHGLNGGKPGAPTWSIVNPDTENRMLPVLITDPVTLVKGDLFSHLLPGGGGNGDPLERDPEHVLKDVLEERVTRNHARKEYGVVILEGDPPVLDRDQTDHLRAEMHAGRQGSQGR